MAEQIPYIRVFISSPGDVPQERDDAQAVVEEINASGEFASHFLLKLYRWDNPDVALPMPATDTPQKSVDLYMIWPSQCDLVVVLFWSKMGSPLVMNDREYLSGTHYEYSEGLEGYERSGKPTIWLYRCEEEPVVRLSDPDRDKKAKQFDRVTQFFKGFTDAEGRFLGGVNFYPTHDDFRVLFKKQLLTHLRHLRDNPQPQRPPDKPIFTGVPYRGLNALDEKDAPIFFGRDAETLEVLSRVESRRLVMVLGASGSGKSSLVAAGVLPKLRERGWQILRLVPGDDPFLSMALAMVSQLEALQVPPVEYLSAARRRAEALRAEPKALVQQLSATLPNARLLLFIDQFEEVFTLAQHNASLSAGEVGRFMDAIRQPTTGGLHLVTLVTMRADFYGVALPYFDTLKEETFGLTRPSAFALYNLITRPAELAGLALDPGLAEEIAESVGTESGGLALVAYLMEALYLKAAARGDKHMTWADYESLGGVQGAINTLANQAYAGLPMAETVRESTMAAVFRELIALTDEEGQLIPTRRRVPLDHFPPETDAGRFVRAFVDARLLVSKGGVEVAHEAILRHWDLLVNWIGRVKGDLALLRQYERDAKTWDERGRDTPPPSHEALVFFEAALHSLDISREALHEPLKLYTEPEAKRLLRELEDIHTSHERRRDIGDRLAVIGDTRHGVGVKPSPLAPCMLEVR